MTLIKDFDNNINYLHAVHYHKLGLNVTCIANIVTEYNFYSNNVLKVPCHKWKEFQKKRQTLVELQSFPWEKAVGVGTIPGFQDLHIIDIDGCLIPAILQDFLELLDLPKDYEWVVQTGSISGYHIYFYSSCFDDLENDVVVSTFPPNLESEHLFDKIEVLWKTHAVLPPSLHRSSHDYSFVNCRMPLKEPKWINIQNFDKIKEKYLNRTKEVRGIFYHEEWVTVEDVKPTSNQDEIQLGEIFTDLFFVFDTETDGLVERQYSRITKFPSIIQIAWMIMDQYGVVYKKSSALLRNNFNHNSEAFKINNLDPEKILKYGQDPRQVFKELTNDLKYCRFIVSHNLEFDLPILRSELEKFSFDTDVTQKQGICTMKSSLSLFTSTSFITPKYPKLTELYKKLFDLNIIQFHNAQSDVLITSKCLRELLKRELIDFGAEWYL